MACPYSASHWECAADGLDSRFRLPFAGMTSVSKGIPFQMTPARHEAAT